MKYVFSFAFLLYLNSIFGMQNSDQPQKLTISEIKQIEKNEEAAHLRFVQEAERVKIQIGPEAFSRLERAWTDDDIEACMKLTEKSKEIEYNSLTFKAIISTREVRTIFADKEIVLDFLEFFACIYSFSMKRMNYIKNTTDVKCPIDYPKLTYKEIQPGVHHKQVFRRISEEGRRVRAQLGEEYFQRLVNVWTEEYAWKVKEAYSTFTLEELTTGITFSISNLNGILTLNRVITIFPDKQIALDFLEFLGFSHELSLLTLQKKYNRAEN